MGSALSTGTRSETCQRSGKAFIKLHFKEKIQAGKMYVQDLKGPSDNDISRECLMGERGELKELDMLQS